MIYIQVADDDGQADRAQVGRTASRSEVALDMIHIQVAVDLSELENLDDGGALPRRIRL